MHTIEDYLNNQFLFFDYLLQLGYSNLIDYLNNNNLNLNHYCTHAYQENEIHYILTSNTTKNNFKGYRLITI
jgi:hypothetical protein